ncbi:MAG TPA: macro domain-containing protein [Chthonomonadaceae bacterium]|nr:macro domain-containing protein [Chthonomonadaceae bacterium]
MFPFIKPVETVKTADLTVELWVAERKFPHFMRSDAIIVPVAPDLKMVFGVAKIARDYGADLIQYEANAVAPLPPGEAFVGTGARYRFKFTALAVIFDQVKRTSPQLIGQAVRRAMQLLQERGVRSVVFPDMTENLLTHPSWITPEQRKATADITAQLMLSAIAASRGDIKTVRIWVWQPANADAFRREMKRLERSGSPRETQAPSPAT